MAAAYRFYPPAAISYTNVTFTAYGKGSTNYMFIGIQDWTTCTSYSTTCVTATHSAPHSGVLAGSAVSSPASKAVYPTSSHSIRGYVFAPASPGVSRTIDLRNVKITVTYKVLG